MYAVVLVRATFHLDRSWLNADVMVGVRPPNIPDMVVTLATFHLEMSRLNAPAAQINHASTQVCDAREWGKCERQGVHESGEAARHLHLFVALTSLGRAVEHIVHVGDLRHVPA